MVVPAPVGATGAEPGAAVPGTQTDSGPHQLDGEDLHAGQTGGVSRKISSLGGVPPPGDTAGYDNADRDKSCARNAKYFGQSRETDFATERPGWVGSGGGIHLRGGALTALAPSQVQSKDGENVENVLLLIFFSMFAQCGKRSALLNGRPTDLFFYTLFLACTIMSGSATPTSHCHAT